MFTSSLADASASGVSHGKIMLDLISTETNQIPAGAESFALQTQDGRRLRGAIFRVEGQARGTIALLQGHNEFIEKYFETIDDLRARGFDVATFDWRCQGGSERELDDPRKGHIDDFALYQNDLEAFINQALVTCTQPYYALAHSMGAAIVLDAAYSARPPFQRLILTAPMIDIGNIRFPNAARWLADTLDMVGMGGRYIPLGNKRSMLEKPYENNKLTTDPDRFARNASVLDKAPELVIGDPTIGWVNAAFRLMSRFESPDYPRRIRTPSLIISCGREQIVSNNAIERFAVNLNNAALVHIPGSKHEILMERDRVRDQFWRAFDAFVPGETFH